ncbi:uncharacterized protein LACBIDRAFT_333679 [Laccaria bicolor S238N-H82]|uniref:Predicted protein n=1 Tax=Laccaria bicolor (strain S238N-H82 / ATCC MYA-4686) TaxID=486041 RepID=B0DWU9_LACBS|nr:uncharacterized protein LACBIDRAFT_333679 [Laccaria bicolor S238N-H82]EDR00995.1 predicted protein [Laccaria bicolor S238N-H82]|eukprot:XP_001888390.1 predicted protein [Laccaria bicolor S238N-H82]
MVTQPISLDTFLHFTRLIAWSRWVTEANDTGNQEVGQTQVKYGPPKKKTAIRAPANDAAMGKTQVQSGPPKKTVAAPKEAQRRPSAAVEVQRRPSNAQVFDGVHIQARLQPSGILANEAAVRPNTANEARVQTSRNVATQAAVRPVNNPVSDAVHSDVVGPGPVPHKSKPAPVLRMYGSTHKSSSAQPTAPAAITTNAGNSNSTLSDLTSTCSDDYDITLPDQPEGANEFANSYSSFDPNDIPSTGKKLTSIRDEDFHPRSFSMHDLGPDEIQAMREACESKDVAYCFSYADKTTRYYHGHELTEGCQSAADWFTTYFDDETKKWHPIPQGFSAPHWPEDYVDAINILREEDELHINSYIIEAAMALDKTRNSGEDVFEILSLEDDLSWDDKNHMRSLLCLEAVTYRFTQPWDGFSFTELGVFIAFFIINGILGAFIAFFIINPV